MSSAVLTIIILVVAIVLFITEKLPIAITALLTSILLFVTGIIDSKTLFSGYTNEVVILITGMFVIGGALFETGVAKKVGNYISKYAKTERQLLLVVMLIAAGLSAFLSNTSTTAVLLPVVIMLADKGNFSRSKLLMPLAYATSLGGMITLVGTNGNLAVQSVMNNSGVKEFGFFEFAWIGIPLTIVGILYMLTIGYKLIPDRGLVVGEDEYTDNEENKDNQTSIKQIIAVLVLLGAIIFMVFEEQIGVPLHIVSIIGALILVVTRTLTEKQAYKSLDLSTIILVASMMPMATALETTGAAKMIADYVVGFVSTNSGPYILVGIIFSITTILTSVMSNTAAAALMAPIALVISNNMGIDPKAVLMTVAVGASAAYATPIGTPPNTMIYIPGNYKFMDYVKCGLPFLIIQLIICLVLIPLVWPFS
ncbi:SLC13 family permease [Mammaliicoccus sciuri]|uniref:SLC13 family permease n=1 Tax=Mammaliicoccus sciuri TaxID=1296 RepID=UPI000ECEB090|nr:SLC13 family permease [Mammaliicoccus sciuri]MDO0950921.1 SLC13 family permease [Mammaliicoccus sciuri]HCW36169.1 cation transporter [Staphylococcus sp.]